MNILSDKKFIKIISTIFGSWHSVIGHTIFFIFMLVFADLLVFTVLISIEAIYIGIFILMAESREELHREQREKNRHFQEKKLVKEDVNLTQHVIEELNKLKVDQKETQKLIRDLQAVLKKTTTP